MKKWIFLSLFFIFQFSFSQNSKIVPQKINSFAFDATVFVGTDAFGYLYGIKNTTFFKTKGSEYFQYQNVSLGEISKVDLINPLKICLFYADFNSVIQLDSQLNPILNFNFSDQNDAIVISSLGLAANNNLWIFDENNRQFGLYNVEKKTYSKINQPISKKIIAYSSDFNYFNFVDEDKNWYTLDFFGKLTSNSKIDNFDAIVFLENQKIIYQKDQKIYFLDAKTSKIQEIEIDKKMIKNFCYKDQILSIFTDEQIINYKIQLP